MIFNLDFMEYEYNEVKKFIKNTIYGFVKKTSFFESVFEKARKKYKSVIYAFYRSLVVLKSKFPFILTKFTKKQLIFLGEIFVKKRDIVIFKGGNKSGKTTALVFACLLKALEKRNSKIWLIVLSFPLGDDVVVEKIKSIVGSIATYNPREQTFTFFNGSKIVLKSIESGALSFQSASVDLVAFDERPPREVFFEAFARTIDTKGQLIMTYTPVEGNDWIYDVFISNEKLDPNIFSIVEVATFQNQFVKSNKLDIIKQLSEEEYIKRVYGYYVINSSITKLDENDLKSLLCFPVTKKTLIVENDVVSEIDAESNDFVFEIFQHPLGTKYVVGVDVATNIGLDNSVITVYTVGGKLAALYYSRKDNTLDLAKKSVYIARKYNNAIINFERNGVGIAFYEAIRQTGYWNIWRDSQGKYGIYLTKDEKNYLLKVFNDLIREKSIELHSKAIEELANVVAKDEKVRFRKGDDFISSILLAVKLIQNERIQIMSYSEKKVENCELRNYSLL